jgi:biopolymer transport protein ExbD
VVRIDITAQNQLLWNGEALADQGQLQSRLLVAARAPEQAEIHVHPDRHTSYDTVAAVLSASQRLGLRKIGVVGLEEYGP